MSGSRDEMMRAIEALEGGGGGVGGASGVAVSLDEAELALLNDLGEEVQVTADGELVYTRQEEVVGGVQYDDQEQEEDDDDDDGAMLPPPPPLQRYAAAAAAAYPYQHQHHQQHHPYHQQQQQQQASSRGSPVKVQVVGRGRALDQKPLLQAGQLQAAQQQRQQHVQLVRGSHGSENQQKVQYFRVVQPSPQQQQQQRASASLRTIAPAGGSVAAKEMGPWGVTAAVANQQRLASMGRFPSPSLNKRKSAVGNKKPCNCTKSACLKLYCDCFANGEFCSNCNCKDCHNNMDHEFERSKAIKGCLERNPHAFQPKIGVTGKGRTDAERLHQKGCHCKKSSCLKNYCECYEAKVSCTARCKCCGCRNTEADRASKSREKLASASSGLLNLAAAAADLRSASPFSDDDSDTAARNEATDPKSMPWFYMTDEVVEATTLCMVAEADGADAPDDDAIERLVLKEFGRCLQQIIHNASAQPSPPPPPPPPPSS